MDILQHAVAALSATTLNRYRLDIPSCTSPLDVESLRGDEGIGRTYRYSITFTSTDHDIGAAQLLRKPVTLTMGTGALWNADDSC